jgi:hypothetical protein
MAFPDSSDTNRRTLETIRRYAAYISLLACVVFCYWNAGSGEFVFDDLQAIVKNDSIRTLTPISASLWAKRDTPTAGRPLVNLSFALNYAFAGLSPSSYRWTNVVLHCLNAWMLFALLCRLQAKLGWASGTWSKNFALLTAVLWAVHPLQVEAVVYVTQRTELLMAFFLLATLLASRMAVDSSTIVSPRFFQVLAVTACGLGMACKEVMVVAPILVVLADRAFGNLSMKQLWKTRKAFYVGLAATWFILIWLLSSDPRGNSAGFSCGSGVGEYLKTQCYAIVHYLRLAVVPSGLCADYGTSLITDFRTWFPRAIFLAAVLLAVVWSCFRSLRIAFWGFWFFLILAPSSSFIPIATEPIAERRMYLPLVAVIVLVMCALQLAWFRLKLRGDSRLYSFLPTAAFIIALGVASIFLFTTRQRVRIYSSEVVFWSDVLSKRPNNARAHQSLGAYWFSRDLQKADEHFLQANRLNPEQADSYFNLGLTRAAQQRHEEAIPLFETTLHLDPTNAAAWIALAGSQLSMGLKSEAIESLRETLRLSPIDIIATEMLSRLIESTPNGANK